MSILVLHPQVRHDLKRVAVVRPARCVTWVSVSHGEPVRGTADLSLLGEAGCRRGPPAAILWRIPTSGGRPRTDERLDFSEPQADRNSATLLEPAGGFGTCDSARALLARPVRARAVLRATSVDVGMTGKTIDEKYSATVTIRYADARKGQVVLDVNASAVEDLAAKGTKQARRGRKPKAT